MAAQQCERTSHHRAVHLKGLGWLYVMSDLSPLKSFLRGTNEESWGEMGQEDGLSLAGSGDWPPGVRVGLRGESGGVQASAPGQHYSGSASPTQGQMIHGPPGSHSGGPSSAFTTEVSGPGLGPVGWNLLSFPHLLCPQLSRWRGLGLAQLSGGGQDCQPAFWPSWRRSVAWELLKLPLPLGFSR